MNPLLTLLVVVSLVPACTSQFPEADLEACEHLAHGPSTNVTAAPPSGPGGPSVDTPHTRFDVTLVDVPGGKGGSVLYPAVGGRYVLFADQEVAIGAAAADGATVEVEDTSAREEACPEIVRRFRFELGVGTYRLSFGPTHVSLLGLVIEPESEHGDH